MTDTRPVSSTQAAVRRIDRILLAIHQAHPGRVETRAALLAPGLGIETFDVLAVKRAGTGLRPTTACSHVQVDADRLTALVDGRRLTLGVPALPEELDKLWTVRHGHPAEVIAGTADSIGADLTLVAGSGRTTLPLWARPTRDADLVRLSRGAVLLVRGEPREVYRRVVVATDFSRASLAAARTAALLAPSAGFVFVHAFRQPEQGREDARRRLDAFVALFLHGLPAGRGEVQAGRAHGVIRDCARRHQADLVVLGRGACHPGARLSCANVMQKLMDDAECDLLIGPDRSGDDGDRRLAA
ncbi:universal stress protein [Massilia sp. LjRoot122]|uniref:universal stress protein n=1 Tax=Massilia sp. LjRoot122 TaxID=3342257 RepID=UPI003ECCF21E